MSRFLARIWQTVHKQRRLVGRDLEGNHFYESNVEEDDPRRRRRTVEYTKSGDLWDSASGISRLPAQWTAWLSHTRTQPPTLDELKNDRARQDRMAINVARLKEKDQEEIRRRAQTLTVQPPLQRLNLNPTDMTSETLSPQAPPSKPIGPTPEPQAWAPRPARRR